MSAKERDPLHSDLCTCKTCQGVRSLVQPTTKPSNPKDAIGSRKWFSSTIPTRVLAELGAAMLEGTLKYGRHNYRDAGVRASVYFDATMRHMWKWFEGEDIDPDSGLSHVTKAIASLIVLRDGMIEGNYNDDRPPKINPQFWADLQKQTEAILEKYPDPVAPFTEERRKK